MNIRVISSRRSVYFVLIVVLLVFISMFAPKDQLTPPMMKFENYSHGNLHESTTRITVYPTVSVQPPSADNVLHNLPANNSSIKRLQLQSLQEAYLSLRSGMDQIKVLRKDAEGRIVDEEVEAADYFRRKLMKSMQLNDDIIDDYFFDRGFDNQPYLDEWEDIPRLLKKYAPVVFKVVPRNMSPVFKTPCWYRRSALKCLPYFYILGMTKCGTSDLWNKTVVHPQVIGTPKETHWWTHRFEGTRSFHGNAGARQSVSFLLKYTTRALAGIDMPDVTDERSTSKRVLGDASPSTLWNNKYWQKVYPQLDEPPYVNADVIRSITPGAKLIIILRDPVERLYSSYNFFQRRRDATPEQFHNLAVATVELFESCMRTGTLRGCTYQSTRSKKPVNFNTDFTGGLYHVYLEEWFRVFPREQILLIELRDWHEHCQENLAKVYKLLELDPVSDDFVQQSCDQPIRVNPKKRTPKPMLEETRRLLEEKYQPFNKNLFDLLQDERFNWRYHK